jgi:hypothetical protein
MAGFAGSERRHDRSARCGWQVAVLQVAQLTAALSQPYKCTGIRDLACARKDAQNISPSTFRQSKLKPFNFRHCAGLRLPWLVNGMCSSNGLRLTQEVRVLQAAAQPSLQTVQEVRHSLCPTAPTPGYALSTLVCSYAIKPDRAASIAIRQAVPYAFPLPAHAPRQSHALISVYPCLLSSHAVRNGPAVQVRAADGPSLSERGSVRASLCCVRRCAACTSSACVESAGGRND